MILSGVLMLKHLKETDAATRLEQPWRGDCRGKYVTYDLKATAMTHAWNARNGRGDLQEA